MKNRGRHALGGASIPDAGDPAWRRWTVALLAFLKGGTRDWLALRSFARAERVPIDVIRHELAWLSVQGLASYNAEEKTWAFVSFAPEK